jgi:hypothetical protein
MKLSVWAKLHGVTYQTARSWFHKGKLPVSARQMPSGTIIVDAPSYTQARNLCLSLPPEDRRTLATVLETSARSTTRRNTSP